MAPNGSVRVFAQISAAHLPGACPGGIGLTTALAILGNDWVVVGSLPTNAGNPATAKAGCLLVLNSDGRVVETFHGHGINGPWDMTAVGGRSVSALFVTNVLNGTVAGNGKVVRRGTVLRLIVTTPERGLPRLIGDTTIGSGFPQETNSSALVIGPTGVGLAGTERCTSPTPSETGSPPYRTRCCAGSAGTGLTVSRNGALAGPLGVAIAPNRNILGVNSLNGKLVEIKPNGSQVAVKKLDTSGSRPAPGRCSAWPSRCTATASTSSTTRPTHWTCCTKTGPASGDPGAGCGPPGRFLPFGYISVLVGNCQYSYP